MWALLVPDLGLLFLQGRGRKEGIENNFSLFILRVCFQKVAWAIFGLGNDCSALAPFWYSHLATQEWFSGFCP